MVDLLTVLLIFMVITAIAVIHMPSLLSAVIAMGALGFGAAVAFLVLGAPDVAIPQIAVDVVRMVILIRATVGSLDGTGLQKLPYGPMTQIARDKTIPLLDIGTMDLIRSGAVGVRPL